MDPKNKKFILTILSAAILVLLFVPGNFPDDLQLQEVLNYVSPDKVLIIFNSGGWGNTPIEEADDCSSLIKGIQETLDDLGYESIVVSYERTQNSFLGRIEGAREYLASFQNQSTRLAREIEYFIEDNPNNKIIMTGLSSGGAFIDNVMEKISEKKINNVLAIEVGVPFWEEPLNSKNILLLNNEGKDSLSERKITTLLFALIKTPFKWALAQISGENLAFSRALHVPDHDYSWNSSSTGPQITAFLKDKFGLQNF